MTECSEQMAHVSEEWKLTWPKEATSLALIFSTEARHPIFGNFTLSLPRSFPYTLPSGSDHWPNSTAHHRRWHIHVLRWTHSRHSSASACWNRTNGVKYDSVISLPYIMSQCACLGILGVNKCMHNSSNLNKAVTPKWSDLFRRSQAWIPIVQRVSECLPGCSEMQNEKRCIKNDCIFPLWLL